MAMCMMKKIAASITTGTQKSGVSPPVAGHAHRPQQLGSQVALLEQSGRLDQRFAVTAGGQQSTEPSPDQSDRTRVTELLADADRPGQRAGVDEPVTDRKLLAMV
jgi:hypothetical protein